MAKVHELKCWTAYFQAIWDRRKRFEVRNDDRGFRVGHRLELREYCPFDEKYSGRYVYARISYILRGDGPSTHGIQPPVVVMSLDEMSNYGRRSWRKA